jgi:hypothetical protein
VLLRDPICYINNKMTKKHFIAIANAVRSLNNDYDKTIVTNFLVQVLSQFNSKFDEKTFVNYINK